MKFNRRIDMVKKITLNDDHLRLIEKLNIEEFYFGENSRHDRLGWGFDQWNLFGGTFVMEDCALILGHYGDFIPGTEDSPLGKQYPKELEDYWWKLYTYIYTNLKLIIKLILQFSSTGGIKAGTYKYADGVFSYVDNQ